MGGGAGRCAFVPRRWSILIVCSSPHWYNPSTRSILLSPKANAIYKEYQFGRIAGLQVTATPMAIIGALLLWAFGLIGVRILAMSIGVALAFGLIGSLLHYLSEVIHNIGHNVAARRTGHPMTGVRLGTFLFFGTSLYPNDEPTLSGKIHIRRALGGPVMSILVGALGLLLPTSNGIFYALIWFLAIDNLFILGLGSLLPLGFTDGSTILYWRGKE
jgi:hypothetical protein